MSGSLQHWLPRFLQKGFASQEKRDGVFVWVHRPDAPPVEVNTRRIGAQNHFYGSPGAGTVDQAITDLEKVDYSPAVDQFREWDPGRPLDGPVAAKLAAHLCVRSRRLRVASDRTMRELLEALFSRMADRSFVRGLLRGDRLRRDTIEKLVAAGMRRQVAKAVSKKKMTLLEPAFMEFAQDLSQRGREVVQQLMPGVVQQSHIRALEESPSADARAKVYEQLAWSVIEFDGTGENLILGDGPCAFKVKGNPRYKALDDKRDVLELVLLPISSRRLVVGSRLPKAIAELTVTSANQAAAECSVEFFLSSMRLPEESSLVTAIGKTASFFTPGEVNGMVEEITSELMARGLESRSSGAGSEDRS
jgi:hypothetical protein